MCIRDSNKLTVGSRGINFTDLNFQCSGNTVTWGAGAVYFTNDSNSLQGIGLSAGSATFTGSTVWIWWFKGNNALLSSTNWSNNPDDVLVAIYHGGNNINANYGRTIINGDYIQTGSVQANRLSVGQLSAITADMGTVFAGMIRNNAGSTQFDVTNGRIIFNNGSVMKVSGSGFGTNNQFIDGSARRCRTSTNAANPMRQAICATMVRPTSAVRCWRAPCATPMRHRS